MNIYDELEKKALAGEISVLDYICATSEEDAKNDMTGFAATRAEACYWTQVRDAHKNGKKLVAFGGSVPVEIFYALDCVPLYVDLLPVALTKSAELTAKFIYDTDVHINSALCGHSKSLLGAVLAKNAGFAADAFVRTSIACPSSDTTLNALEIRLEIPTFSFDPPFRRSERYVELFSNQVENLISFLESITGNKLELRKLRRSMEKTNRSRLLMERCAAVRKNKPCPVSSHTMELGKLMSVLAPTDDMAQLLEAELSVCQALADTGASPCPDGEKHRVFLLQNPLWCGTDIIKWLEREYNAVTVMDGLCYERGALFEHMDTIGECCLELAAELFVPLMLHGAAAPGQRVIELAEQVMRDYEPDVCLFLGSVGCRHTWAVSKMLTDTIRQKFNVATLFADVDSVDAHYKDENQIKTQIAEFMDTVILGK